jgi:hypothetical protein
MALRESRTTTIYSEGIIMATTPNADNAGREPLTRDQIEAEIDSLVIDLSGSPDFDALTETEEDRLGHYWRRIAPPSVDSHLGASGFPEIINQTIEALRNCLCEEGQLRAKYRDSLAKIESFLGAFTVADLFDSLSPEEDLKRAYAEQGSEILQGRSELAQLAEDVQGPIAGLLAADPLKITDTLKVMRWVLLVLIMVARRGFAAFCRNHGAGPGPGDAD